MVAATASSIPAGGAAMAYHHDVSRCLAKFVARMRDRITDEICASRIERYLARNPRADVASGFGKSEERDSGIDAAVAQMEPLTRAILILVAGRRMSVAEVARRFSMSEERVCRHFRLAVETVAKRRGGGKG